MKKYYPEIFNEDQLEIFPKLSFLKKEGFYLAGGTALALQIGHRTSVDFDFYSKEHFHPDDLYQQIEDIFERKAKKTGQEKDTLFCTVNRVDLSFFWYKYPLIKKTEIFQGVALASLEDIAGMKLIAVSGRPAKRDYIDVFFLLKKFSFEKMFSFVSEKYPNFNQYWTLRALSYFEDIEEKEREEKIKMLNKNFSWEKAKKKIFKEVKEYQLKMIKKK